MTQVQEQEPGSIQTPKPHSPQTAFAPDPIPRRSQAVCPWARAHLPGPPPPLIMAHKIPCVWSLISTIQVFLSWQHRTRENARALDLRQALPLPLAPGQVIRPRRGSRWPPLASVELWPLWGEGRVMTPAPQGPAKFKGEVTCEPVQQQTRNTADLH